MFKVFGKSETLFTKRVSSMETNWKHYKMRTQQNLDFFMTRLFISSANLMASLASSIE